MIPVMPSELTLFVWAASLAAPLMAAIAGKKRVRQFEGYKIGDYLLSP